MTAASPPASSAQKAHAAAAFQQTLLFKADVRDAFFEDRARTLAEHDVPDAVRPLFFALDEAGLRADADMRARPLMRALVRPYWLTCSMLGTMPEGADRLRAFLSSPALFAPLSERTEAFGLFLQRMIELTERTRPAPVQRLLEAAHALEHTRHLAATALRTHIADGHAVPVPTAAPENPAADATLRMAPFCAVAPLPQPQDIVTAALENTDAEGAWMRIEAGLLDAGRLDAVARALPVPTLVAHRAIADAAPDSDGITPAAVRFLTASFSAALAPVIRAAQAETRWDALDAATQRSALALARAHIVTIA